MNQNRQMGKLVRAIGILGVFSLWMQPLFGQVSISRDTNLLGCAGNLLDSGGKNNPYTPGESWSTTLCPDAAGAGIRIFFNTLDLGAGDTLWIFDGSNTSAPLLSTLTAASEDSLQFQATIDNTGGCLTVLFKADQSVEGAGWDASWSCGLRCQRTVVSVFDISPPQDSEGVVVLCSGVSLSAFASLSFPQNNTSYRQSTASTRFFWTLGSDMKSSGQGMRMLPVNPGQWPLKLKVIDSAGCQTDILVADVLVVPRPIFQVSSEALSPVCLGDTLTLNVSTGRFDPTKRISVLPGSVSLLSGQILQPSIQQVRWRFQPTMIFQQRDSVAAVPDTAGRSVFLLQVADTLGCIAEEAFAVDVNPAGGAGCSACIGSPPEISDLEICAGDSVQVDVEVAVPVDSIFSFKTNPQYVLGYANHPPGSPYNAMLPVQAIPFTKLDQPQLQISKVCLTILTDWAEDLTVNLSAPSGEVMPLFSGVGGGDDHFIQTCFSPSASSDIASGSAPFTGTFKPQGNWDALKGALAVGNWSLMVSDGFDSLAYGRVEAWSIVFDGENAISYTWSPGKDLSCTDCAKPILSPTASTSFQFQVADKKGCVATDTFTVIVRDTLRAPEVECTFNQSGQAIFSWTSVANAASYKIGFQVNNKDSIFTLPALDTFFLPSGYYNTGDVLRLTVEPHPDSAWLLCGVETGIVGCVFEPCSIRGKVLSKTDASCTGSSTGGVVLDGQGGFPPYQYQLNALGAIQSVNRFDGLAAGDYFVLVLDQNNCADTVFFEIDEPAPVQAIATIADSIRCSGEVTGVLAATASGGVGGYRFNWSTGESGDTIRQVGPGRYILTAIDSIGCSNTDSITLSWPEPLSLQLNAVPPSCHNTMNGRIIAKTIGGTGAVQFNWSTGYFGDTLTGLGAGNFCVTATDQNGCVQLACSELTTPTPLQKDSMMIVPIDCYGRRTGEAWVYMSGGTRPYQYTWSDPLAQVGPVATLLGGGYVGLKVEDANGCIYTDSILIPEPALLEATMVSVPVNCRNGADGSITAVPKGGIAPYTYRWNTGDTEPIRTNLSAGQYAVTLTDSKGCRAFAQGAVTEPATELDVTVEQTLAGCFGAKKNQARATVSGGTGPGYRFRWSTGETTSELIGLDSLKYSVTVTDVNGCTTQDSLVLKDLPVMNPNMIVNAPFCFGGNNGEIGINFIEGRPQADFNAFSFRWSTGGVGPTISNLQGDRFYTVTVTDPIGCTSIVTRYLRQPDPIVVKTDKADASCYGGSDGKAWVSSVQAETKNFSYRWELPSGAAQGIEIKNLVAGIYRVVVSDERGCFGEGSIQIGQPNPLSAAFLIGNNICFGDATGSLQVVPSGGIPPYRINWNDGVIGAQRKGLTAGSYAITLTDSKNCQTAASVELGANSRLSAILEVVDVTCNGGRDGVLEIAVKGGKAPYAFSLDGENYKLTPALIGLAAGNYDVYVRDANGCQIFERAVVREPAPFVVDAGLENYYIKLGDTLGLQATTTGNQGLVKFSWIAPVPGTLTCSECQTTQSFTQNTISYQLMGVDSAGCEASDRVTVHVRKDRDILVPTGFSPNGDGLNDLLLIHGLNGTKILDFQVFDRWGELVFQKRDFLVNDPSVGWDGTFKDQPMNPGLFVWFIEAEYIDGYKEVRRGQTTLIR